MAWRLRAQLRKAPGNVDAVADALEEFEARAREVNAAPRGNAMNVALTWPVHKLHFEKNRFLHDARYVHNTIDDRLLKYLVKVKIADGPLLAKWRKPGYDCVCSMAVLTKSNTNFGTVGICRTPLKDRTGQIMPNVQTGCVCCVSGSGGPIWWDDPVPDIVKEQILEVDPGKAHLFEEDEEKRRGSDAASGDDGVYGGEGEAAAGAAESVDADRVADRPAGNVSPSVGEKRALKPLDSPPRDDVANGDADDSGNGGEHRTEESACAGESDGEVEPVAKKSRGDST